MWKSDFIPPTLLPVEIGNYKDNYQTQEYLTLITNNMLSLSNCEEAVELAELSSDYSWGAICTALSYSLYRLSVSFKETSTVFVHSCLRVVSLSKTSKWSKFVNTKCRIKNQRIKMLDIGFKIINVGCNILDARCRIYLLFLLINSTWTPHQIIFECIGKPSLASEGTLPTNDGLLGCELEAVHDVVVLDLSLRIRQYLPPNPTPLV